MAYYLVALTTVCFAAVMDRVLSRFDNTFNVFSPSHLSAADTLHFVVCRLGHDMPVSLVLCHLSRHRVSGRILFHQVSPSQLWSASISLSIYRHLQDLSRGIIFISPLHMSKPSQPLLSEEFRHRVHVCLFPDVYISHMINQMCYQMYSCSISNTCVPVLDGASDNDIGTRGVNWG